MTQQVRPVAAKHWSLQLLAVLALAACSYEQQTSGFADSTVEGALLSPNVALNKPIAGSAPCVSTEGPEKAVNGSVSGGWSDKWCSMAETKFLQVDLGQQYDLQSVVLHHAGAGGETELWNTRDFYIEISADGIHYVAVDGLVGNVANVTTHTISGTARYVRVNITDPTSDELRKEARIYEFEVFGAPAAEVNVALFKPAIGSAPCVRTEGPEKAVNGSISGGWSDKWCSDVSRKYLQVDLGRVFDLSRVVLHHAGAGNEPTIWNTRDFTIQTSTDGTSFVPVATVVGNVANVTTHLISSSARYVRLNIRNATSDPIRKEARIYELEVFSPQPVEVNAALNKPAIGSTPCDSTEGPEKAVNGSVSAGLSDKWCSVAETKFLQVDLGQQFDLHNIVLHHSGAGNEPVVWNTSDFNIETSTDGVNFGQILTVVGNTANVSVHPVSATGRYLRLNVLDPAATIYELQAFGVQH